MGVHSTFTPEVAAEICRRLKTGEPLMRICVTDGFPCDDTVRNWAAADPVFARDIARAREIGFDAIALEALDIADDKSQDTIIVGATDDYEGREQPNTEWITRSRLRVDTRLKLLAKWDPKRYGDSVKLTGDAENPVSIASVVRTVVDPKG